jgi:hypothetical protein
MKRILLHNLKIRLDVPDNLLGYYFKFYNYKLLKVYSVVNFAWLKEGVHKAYYVEGVYCSWEALGDDYETFRAKTLMELLEKIV